MEPKTPPRRVIKLNRGKPKSPVICGATPSNTVTQEHDFPSTSDIDKPSSQTNDIHIADIRHAKSTKDVECSTGTSESAVVQKTDHEVTKKELHLNAAEQEEVEDLFKHFLARKMEIIELERSILENDSAIAQKMIQEKEIAMRKKLEEKHSRMINLQKAQNVQEKDSNEEKDRDYMHVEKESKKHKHKKHKKDKKSKKKDRDKDKSREKSSSKLTNSSMEALSYSGSQDHDNLIEKANSQSQPLDLYHSSKSSCKIEVRGRSETVCPSTSQTAHQSDEKIKGKSKLGSQEKLHASGTQDKYDWNRIDQEDTCACHSYSECTHHNDLERRSENKGNNKLDEVKKVSKYSVIHDPTVGKTSDIGFQFSEKRSHKRGSKDSSRSPKSDHKGRENKGRVTHNEMSQDNVERVHRHKYTNDGLSNIPSWDDRHKMKELDNALAWDERQKVREKHSQKKVNKEMKMSVEDIEEEYNARIMNEIKDALEKKGIKRPLPDKLELSSVPKKKKDNDNVEELKAESRECQIEVHASSETPTCSKGDEVYPSGITANEGNICVDEDEATETNENVEERPFRVMIIKKSDEDGEGDIVDFTERVITKFNSGAGLERKNTGNNEEKDIEVDGGGKRKEAPMDMITENDNTVKKSAVSHKFGLKISETSAALISSGVKVENDIKKKNREEGEITDTSGDGDSSSSDDDGDNLETVGELESSGQLSDSDEGSKSSSSKKKKRKKKKKEKKHKKKKKKSSKEKKRSKKHKRSRSKSRSRSPHRKSYDYDNVLGVWRSRSRSRTPVGRRKSRSRSPERRRKSRERSPLHSFYRDRRNERFSRGGFGSRGYRSRSRSRSRSRERMSRETREDLRLKIDKSKLREIAIKNAYANIHSGRGPKMDLKPEELAALKSGGKSIDELTDFCKKIAERQVGLSSDSDSDGLGRPVSDEEDAPFINHPFKVRPQEPIMMNIRNAKQLPILSASEKQSKAAELRLQFPVSSGSHHKVKESEWVPVQKTSAPPTTTTTTVSIPGSAPKTETVTKETAVTATVTSAPSNPVAPTPLWALSLPPPPPPPCHPGDVAQALAAQGTTNAAAPPCAASLPPPPPPPPPLTEDKVFPDPPKEPINIGAIVSERLSAMRKLQDNPNDVQALGTMYKSQQDMNKWAASKLLPGQFTGSTGVQAMSQQEIMGVHPKHQAWLKKDTFTKAAPVSGGIGKMLLQRMGWNEGEGLGTNKQGQKEPLMLEFKIDRKGLTSQGENAKKSSAVPALKDLSGKHPVSALVELCNRRRWGAPDFQMVHESGPDHKKNFLFKVCINGMEYQASIASNNKKHAKAQAAAVCLQELGLIPKS